MKRKNLSKRDYGFIEFDSYTEGSVKEGVINAYSKNKPVFINLVDEIIWNDFWNRESEKKGIEYVSGQSRFSKEISWSEELKDVKAQFQNLLEFYNSSAKKYNKDISDDYFKNRKKVLDSILSKYL